MKRKAEPELMNGKIQAEAYALGDFEEPHSLFIQLLQHTFPGQEVGPWIVELGCGTADISLRIAKAFPWCKIHGVDGSLPMLKFGRQAISTAGLSDQIQLHRGYLPGADLPRPFYHTIVSNSLLHHLADPLTLWKEIRRLGRSGSGIFVMDLIRPNDLQETQDLVQTYCGKEAKILQRDFYCSLLAAYRTDEIIAQLRETELDHLELRTVSDRHLIIYGRNL